MTSSASPSARLSLKELQAAMCHPFTRCCPACAWARIYRWLRLDHPAAAAAATWSATSNMGSSSGSAVEELGARAHAPLRLRLFMADPASCGRPSGPDPASDALPQELETFLGNAGVIQAFGNADALDNRAPIEDAGRDASVERRDIRVSAGRWRLATPGAATSARRSRSTRMGHTPGFQRESGRQLILVPGRPPIYMQRSTAMI